MQNLVRNNKLQNIDPICLGSPVAKEVVQEDRLHNVDKETQFAKNMARMAGCIKVILLLQKFVRSDPIRQFGTKKVSRDIN